MATADRSSRCSARVEPSGHQPTDQRGHGQQFAPESLPDPAGSAAPERGRPTATKPGTQHGRGPGRNSQREQAARLRHRLSPRDQAVLHTLDAHRFLTTRQLMRFQFVEHTTPAAAARICRRVLGRLLQLGVIEHLERRVGGVRAGSASYVWRVGVLGDQLLRLDAPNRPRGRRKEPSLWHLEHCLAIGDTHLRLLELGRAGQVELLQVGTEPHCWRSFLGLGGNRETLKPDLFAVTGQGEFEDHWFLEIDRATESLPTLLRKCAQYEDYRRSGNLQASGGVFPLVVWVMPDDAYADKLAAAVLASHNLDSQLYRVCTLDSLAAVITGVPA